MASRVRLSGPNPEAAEPERPPPALASELLEEIFLRVASPADLVRVSAACVSFRRLIADHTFLRRYRSIHPPQLLGFIGYSGCFHSLQAPHPSAAVSRAVARAANFPFDYVPLPITVTEGCWQPCDVRNGRVLVGCHSGEGPFYWDLAVCDPMSRGYLLLPPITDDLLASVGLRKQNVLRTGAFFIPSGGIEDTSFSVIFWMQSETMFGVSVFSSVSNCWSVSMSTNEDVLGLNKIYGTPSGLCNDCFHWKVYGMSTLIKLDMNTRRFCTVDLPPGHDNQLIAIVESGESKLGMISLSYEGASLDYYTFSRNGSAKSHEWRMMNTIPLPANYSRRHFFGPVEGYIFLEAITEDATEFFSLEIKSFRIERLAIAGFTYCGHPYFGFPPSMSPIRIQGYGEVKAPS